jgi:hypothetical protein
MKKIFYVVVLIGLLANASCKKSTDGNKNIILVENTKTADSFVTEITKRYVGEDGTSALVTIKESEKDNTISVRSNNKIISAALKSKTADGGIYSNFDFEIVAKGDTVTITQEKNVIVLVKAPGE